MNSNFKIRRSPQQGANASNLWSNFGANSTDHDQHLAGQNSDPLIKSAEHTIPKPEISIMVEKALRSSPYVDSTAIRVLTKGNRINLSGKVRTWFQKEEAGRVAKLASGNFNIVNDIAISYFS